MSSLLRGQPWAIQGCFVQGVLNNSRQCQVLTSTYLQRRAVCKSPKNLRNPIADCQTKEFCGLTLRNEPMNFAEQRFTDLFACPHLYIKLQKLVSFFRQKKYKSGSFTRFASLSKYFWQVILLWPERQAFEILEDIIVQLLFNRSSQNRVFFSTLICFVVLWLWFSFRSLFPKTVVPWQNSCLEECACALQRGEIKERMHVEEIPEKWKTKMNEWERITCLGRLYFLFL